MNEFWIKAKDYQVFFFMIIQLAILFFGFLKMNKKQDSTQMTELIKIISRSVENQEKQSQATHEIAVEFKGMASFIAADSQNKIEKLHDIKVNQTNYQKRLDGLYKEDLPKVIVKLTDIEKRLEKIDLQTSLCPKIKELME